MTAPAFYSVVQYYPDPNADERINIGVVAYHNATVRVRFLSEWSRVKRFGGEDVSFLKDFTRRFQRVVAYQTDMAREAHTLGVDLVPEPPAPEITAETLERMFAEWSNSIRFTEPRASIQGVEALLSETARRYLVVHRPQSTRPRDQRTASSVVVSKVRKGLTNILPPEVAETLLRTDYKLGGARQDHYFDVALANGSAYFVAQSASFEVPDPTSKALHQRLDSIAWALSDARPREQGIEIGVMALPPATEMPHADEMQGLYDERTALFSDLGATILPENAVESWAESLVRFLK